MLAYPLAILYVLQYLGFQEVSIPMHRDRPLAFMEFADQRIYTLLAVGLGLGQSLRSSPLQPPEESVPLETGAVPALESPQTPAPAVAKADDDEPDHATPAAPRSPSDDDARATPALDRQSAIGRIEADGPRPPSRSRRATGMSAAPPTARPHSPPEPSLMEALDLLHRAERALHGDAPELAMGFLSDLDRRTPRHLLREERLATRALAACALGRPDEARAARRELMTEAPASIYLLRLEQSCITHSESALEHPSAR